MNREVHSHLCYAPNSGMCPSSREKCLLYTVLLLSVSVVISGCTLHQQILCGSSNICCQISMPDIYVNSQHYSICPKPPRILLPAIVSEHLPTSKSLAQLPCPLLLLYSKTRLYDI